MPTQTYNLFNQQSQFNLYNQQNQSVKDAYAMLTANIHLSNGEHKLKSLVLASCKPGVGKTTIAISLAITMAESGWKTLLVDADFRKPSVSKRLNTEKILGLSDYLSRKKELDEIIYSTNVENLYYISSGQNSVNPIGLLCSSNFETFMKESRENFDFIIFDTPALSSVADASLVAAKADAVLMVVEMGETTLNSLRPAVDQLEKVNSKILGVVLSKVKKNDYKKHFSYYDYFRDSRKFLKKSKIAKKA